MPDVERPLHAAGGDPGGERLPRPLTRSSFSALPTSWLSHPATASHGGDLDITAPSRSSAKARRGRSSTAAGRPPARHPRCAASTGCSRSTRRAGDVSLSALTVREGYSALPGGGIATASPGRAAADRRQRLDQLLGQARRRHQQRRRRAGRADRLDARRQRRQGGRQRAQQRGGGQRADRPEQHGQGQPRAATRSAARRSSTTARWAPGASIEVHPVDDVRQPVAGRRRRASATTARAASWSTARRCRATPPRATAARSTTSAAASR